MREKMKKYYNIYADLQKRQDLWNIFTRKEEYNPNRLDRHERFSYSSSNYVDILKPKVSEEIMKKGLKIQYPDNKKFAVCLTHDVDDIYVKILHILKYSLYFPENKELKGLVNLAKGFVNKKKSPYINFKKIIDLEKKYGASSSFYFFANGIDIFGYKYEPDEIKEIMEYLVKQNCEIGLHVGYDSYNNLIKLKDEKKKLEKITKTKIIGSRNHALRFKIPDSWEVLSKAGLCYDTTLGYHDMIGFRNGMCHPFKPYNIKKNKFIDLVEITLNIQDMTLRFHMNLDVTKSWESIKKMIDKVRSLNGVLTILWHNWTYAFPVSYAGMFGESWTKLYEKILRYCNEKDAWMTTCKDLYYNFKSQDFLETYQ
jgi:peptidoglycan/xylan/chitin deacetylase (PgdA/CDA1 family)